MSSSRPLRRLVASSIFAPQEAHRAEPGGFFVNPHEAQMTGFAAAIGVHGTALDPTPPSRNILRAPVSSYAVSGVSREVRAPPSLPSALELGRDSSDELDPELLALPDPPRRERTLTVVILGLAAVLSLAMVFALRRDVAYAFASHTPGDVGELRTAAGETLAASENRLVRAEGMPGAAGGIRYERPFLDDTFRTLPVAGREDVWVDVRVPAGQESGRWEPPRVFTGRLVRFGAAGPRHRGLASAIERTTGSTVPSGAWLLVDGEEPGSARWTALLAAMFLGFAAWNAVEIRRIVRKVR
jgi:hypothetical protein